MWFEGNSTNSRPILCAGSIHSVGRRVRQVFKKNCEICAGFLFRPPFGLLFSRFAPHLPPTHPTRRAEAVSAVYEFHKLRAAKVKGGNGSITCDSPCRDRRTLWRGGA